MVMVGPPGQSPQHKRADFQPRPICDLNPPLPCMVTHAQVGGFRTWTSWGPYFPAERGSLAHSERRSARLTQCVLGAGTLRPRAWSRGSEGPPAPRAAPGRWPLPGRGRAAGGPGAGSGGRGWTSSQARRASPWQCGRAAGAAATRPPPPLPTVVTGALPGLWVLQALPSHHPPGRAFPGLRSQCRTDRGQGATSQARPRGFGPGAGLEPAQRLRQTHLEGQRRRTSVCLVAQENHYDRLGQPRGWAGRCLHLPVASGRAVAGSEREGPVLACPGPTSKREADGASMGSPGTPCLT